MIVQLVVKAITVTFIATELSATVTHFRSRYGTNENMFDQIDIAMQENEIITVQWVNGANQSSGSVANT